MTERKAGFLTIIIMVLLIAVLTFSAVTWDKALTYICYGLSFFGIAWIYKAIWRFIEKDARK